jgi:hypothetical protein
MSAKQLLLAIIVIFITVFVIVTVLSPKQSINYKPGVVTVFTNVPNPIQGSDPRLQGN